MPATERPQPSSSVEWARETTMEFADFRLEPDGPRTRPGRWRPDLPRQPLGAQRRPNQEEVSEQAMGHPK